MIYPRAHSLGFVSDLPSLRALWTPLRGVEPGPPRYLLSVFKPRYSPAVFPAWVPVLRDGGGLVNLLFCVCLFSRQGFSVSPWLSWNSPVDQAGLKLTEIHLPQLP